MSNYELITKLEKLDYFNSLLKGGIIPVTLIDYKVIYEWYLNELKRLSPSGKQSTTIKRQAKCNTAEEFSVSEVQVYKIIQKMKG
tara:strand:- start:36 stop:290 length:255 start_codon:yes stop_codon:yes gene_type:complete